jgi:hypothetical protein
MFASRLLPLAVALGLGLSPAAFANGRPPATDDLHFRQGHPQDVLAGLTFGLIASHDGGATWSSWVCEKVLHYGGQYDPFYVYTASGAIFATSFDGLLVNRGGACTFDPTALGKLFISTIELASNGALFVAVSDPTESKIYKSTDDGVTFPIVANPGQANDWWQSLLAAPSNPSRLYLSGYRIMGANKALLLFRSDDGGVSFQPLSIAAFKTSSLSVLSLAAVSPTDPNLVFARVSYQNGVIGDAIYRSPDAGVTWTKVLEAGDAIPGFVVRKAGPIFAGTSKSGTYTSADHGVSFTPVTPSLQVNCFVETPDGSKLWACAQNYDPDHMGIAASADGLTWTKVLRYQDIGAPLACAAGTDQKDFCEAMIWCGLRQQLGITSTAVTCAAPAEGPATEAPPDAGKPPTKTGCCDAGSQPSGVVLGALVALLLVRPRRR